MKEKLIFTLILCGFCFITAIPIVQAQAYSGIVSIDSVEVEKGEHFALPVRLSNNNIDIAGLMVPIRYPSSVLTVDSVSFNGSIITSDYNGNAYLGDPDVIQITYILTSYQSPIPTIPMANGIIATIYFGVSQNASEGLITIDSVNQDSPIWRKIHLSDETGFITYLPDFVSGKVVVKMALGIDNNIESGLPKEFSLTQNYPNPFNPSTIIEFALPKSGAVKLEVYNILGQTVNTLVDRTLGAGKHQVEFNASELPSGIYFYRLIHQDGSETKKMILVK